MKIGEALRRLRTDRGLSQVGAARRAGVPDSRTLSHWETDRKKPSLTLLHGYLTGLGLDFCDLQRPRISSLQLEFLAQPLRPSLGPGIWPGRAWPDARTRAWNALNAVGEPSPTGCRMQLERLASRVAELERQLGLEVGRKAEEAAAGGRRDPVQELSASREPKTRNPERVRYQSPG